MSPRLIILAGLPQKEDIELEVENDTRFLIGRSLECDLQIKNIGVSREHCCIVQDDLCFHLNDLGSRNGTFVNHLPIESHLLRHGDEIVIGNARVMFASKKQKGFPQVSLDDGSLTTKSAIRLRPNFDTDEFTPDLFTLVKLGKAINEITDINSLQYEFLKIILEFIPAKRGTIILADEGLNDMKSVSCKKSDTSGGGTIHISRTVCQHVLTEGVALLSNDLSRDKLDATESLLNSRISSLLCVPMTIGLGKGLIYLDSNITDNRFTKTHLEQMTALSFLISSALENAGHIEDLREENKSLREQQEIETDMIGESKAIKEVFYLISRFAPTDSTVLITGESGTGKELVAQSIHKTSSRSKQPFVAVNCAVLNENLLESELFGYEKGAFTGASATKKGKLEVAEGGTVFLDEIGDLDLGIQANLLRFLQEREFERVGGIRTIKANVRILAATNRNLEEGVKNGTFRQDLFFRLNVLQIKMPALRDRKSDISLLAQYFIRKHSEKSDREVKGLSLRVKRLLANYTWEGNVRELENVIEYAMVLGNSNMILPEDLPSEFSEKTGFDEPPSGSLNDQLKDAKQKIIVRALTAANYNYSKAAAQLGVHPNNLHRLIRTLELKDEIKNLI